jgi:hypothetical protein
MFEEKCSEHTLHCDNDYSFTGIGMFFILSDSCSKQKIKNFSSKLAGTKHETKTNIGREDLMQDLTFSGR